MTNVLIATDKPFAPVAVKGIQDILAKTGYTITLLEKYTSRQQLLDAVKAANALIVRSDIIDDEVFNAAPMLRIVVRAGAGYDNIDLESATRHGVVVMNTPGQNSNAVAELALGLMVYAVRHLFNGTSGTELMGKKLGIHAFGNVGRNVARIAQGFGMDIYAYDAYCSDQSMTVAGVTPVHSAEDLYSLSDIVSVHIPATAETRGSLNYNLLSRMPQGAVLVNTARKEVVNEEDLMRLMTERPKMSYVTDVMPANDVKMRELFADRYFATPKKMGAQTAEANTNAGLAAANQIVEYIENGNTKFQVNR